MEQRVGQVGDDTPHHTAGTTDGCTSRAICLPVHAGDRGLAQFGPPDRLIVEGNAAESTQNLMAHERLFQFSIACDPIYCAGVAVLLAALSMILKPVNRSLAMLWVFWRLVYALMWVRRSRRT
ncbi:MAG: hypothetical protein DMG53_14335 [Acidobacteria bacterium]|nr:MAG: hypothetical protein DMG53_14335 [Acidobacteriota bacterium]